MGADEKTQKEIADMMGISQSTIRLEKSNLEIKKGNVKARLRYKIPLNSK